MSDDVAELPDRPATELAALLRRREVSAVELLELHLERIQRLDPALNAIPTHTFDRARTEAARADDALAKGEAVGPLEGLPIAFKDLQDTAGVRTTLGSPVLADRVPAADSLTVARIRAAGAIGVGKTNVPEFGAGSQTYNPVFGATRNPYDPTRTPGGSSGGAAAALATGMIALADGSDYGGSLRNPASFCNVVGFRSTPGRVPDEDPGPWSLSVDGPMGRTVGDVALLFSVMAGPDPRAPGALDTPGATFRDPRGDVRGRRVALAPRFAGLPMDPAVQAPVEAAGRVFEALGCHVEPAEPDMTGAEEAFLAPRHVSFRDSILSLVPGDRVAELKPEIRWHVDEGARVTGDDLQRAAEARRRLIERFTVFMTRFDALVLPVNQVLPFPVESTWPREIQGTAMPTYLDWMRACWFVSLLGAPAISVPAAFAGDLPVGIQIVGRPLDDLGVLQLAAAFETASGEIWRRRPYPSRS